MNKEISGMLEDAVSKMEQEEDSVVASMREIYNVVKDKTDPFGKAIREVLLQEVAKKKSKVEEAIKTMNDIMSERVIEGLSEDVQDMHINTMASWQRRVKTLKEILREEYTKEG